MGIRGIRCISSPTWLSTLEGAPWVTLTPGAPACMDHKGDREDWDWSQGFLVTEEFKMASFWHMFASFWQVGCFWFILHTNLSERNVLAEIIWVLRKSMMIKIYLGIIHHEFHQRSHACSCGDSKNWWIYGPQRRWRNHSWKNRHQRIRIAPRYPKWHMCPSGLNSHCFHITGGENSSTQFHRVFFSYPSYKKTSYFFGGMKWIPTFLSLWSKDWLDRNNRYQSKKIPRVCKWILWSIYVTCAL